MCEKCFKHWRLSFMLAIILTITANVFNFISFISPRWIVSKAGFNKEFESLGLWVACFRNFIFAEDYMAKAYKGCWYIYYPEYRYIRFWLIPMWFYSVQILSIINITCSFGSLILVIQKVANISTMFCGRTNYPIILLQSITVACLAYVTIYVGLKSVDRDWMPFSDQNRVSWGFAFAATAGVLTCLSCFCFLVDSLAEYSDSLEYASLVSEHGQLATYIEGSSVDIGGSRFRTSITGVPSLFRTASGHSILREPAGSVLSADLTSGLQSRLEGLRTNIVETGAGARMPHETSAAVASAKLRQQLHSQRATSDAIKSSVSLDRRGTAEPAGFDRDSSARLPTSSEGSLIYGVKRHLYLTKDSAV